MKPALLLATVAAVSPAFAQDAAVATTFPSRSIAEHDSPITHFLLGPKAKTFYTASVGELRAYDVKTGELAWNHALNPIPVTGIGLGDSILAFSQGFTAFHTLDPETGEQAKGGVGAPNVMSASTCLVVDPKDRWVWIGTAKGVMSRLTPGDVNGWSTRAMKNGGVECVALDPAAKTLAVGGKNGTIRFVGHKSANVDDKKILTSDDESVTALAFGPKGKLLAAGGMRGALRVWKVASAKVDLELDTGLAPIESLVFAPKAKWLAVAKNGVVTLYDLGKGEVLATLKHDSEDRIVALAVLDKGKTLVAVRGKSVTLWDLSEL